MLASINPLGERSRNRRWGATFAWYFAGSLLGGAVMGAAFGVLGAAFAAVAHVGATATAVMVIVAGAVALAFETHAFGLALPTMHRQVNEDWLSRYRAWVYGGGFGFQLGLGLVTIVTSATVYLTWALAFIAGSVPAGLLIGLTFGIVRALPMLLVARVDTPGGLRDRLRAFNASAPTAKRIALVTVFAVPLIGVLVVGAAA
jgi:Cytochrome C biogenesis protein transmembrane region